MASSYVSRPEIQDALERRFCAGANPIVVCGPPGCGKSAAVRAWTENSDSPVVEVALGDAGDVDTLLERLAAALGPLEGVDTDVIEHALRAAGDVTVVLDDFDRLVDDGVDILRRWRDALPRVRWVVTSRQRLDVAGGEVVDVGPMTREQAVELFRRGARRVRSSFTLDDELRPVVEELVEKLDFIPLAITLAAARVNTLGPAAILKRLPQRFRILRGRDTTLRKAIALSWELLDEWERDVLGQCIVFQGGFTVEAAEEVVRLDDDAPWVVDVLGGLVEKSLLRSLETEIAGEVRFEILASIREFVAQHAEADAQVQQRHGAYYLDHCRQLSYATRRSGGADARVRLAHEQHNLLAALDATEDPSVAADLALLLDKLFRLQGTSTRWERVLGRALETTGQLDGSRLARLRRASGEYLLLHGRFDESATALEDAIEVASASGEDVTLAWTHFLRGELERRRGRPSEALDHLDAAIEIADDHEIRHVKRMALGHRAGCLVDVGALDDARDAVAQMERLPPSDDLRDEANLLKRVAYAQYYLGNLAEQRRLTREALELARAGGDHRLEATCIQGLGDAAFANGDYDEALSAWGEALELHRAHGSAELEGALLGNLGNLYHRMDRLEEARVAYRQALKLHAATGAKPYEAVTWFGLGVLELEQGHLDDAAAALRTAADLNEAIGNQAEIGSCRLVAAWVAQRADIDAAALLDEARRAFEKADEDDWAALVDASRSAQPASSAEDPVVQLCIRALQGEQVDDRSRLHVRAALARSSAPEDQPVTLPDLRIARDASWFETDDERIDLRRRRAPRHILARLVELRCKAPEATLDVQEAFEVGWPGEIATASAASDRVYWAIRTLRKLGLEDFLITGGEGYLLAPDAAIAIED